MALNMCIATGNYFWKPFKFNWKAFAGFSASLFEIILRVRINICTNCFVRLFASLLEAFFAIVCNIHFQFFKYFSSQFAGFPSCFLLQVFLPV